MQVVPRVGERSQQRSNDDAKNEELRDGRVCEARGDHRVAADCCNSLCCAEVVRMATKEDSQRKAHSRLDCIYAHVREWPSWVYRGGEKSEWRGGLD